VKWFEFSIEERNGEQEYTYDYLVKAKDVEEARQKARRAARTWYGRPDGIETHEGYEEEPWFSFLGGAVMTQVQSVKETTKRSFTKTLLDRWTWKG